MRRKLLLLFICYGTIPIIIIYSVATNIFNKRAEINLKNIYSNDIKNMAHVAENYFSESLDLTMYPLLDPNLYKFYTTSSDSPNFHEISNNALYILTTSPYVFGGNRGVIMMRKDGVQISTYSNYISNHTILDYQMEQAYLLGGGVFWEFKEHNSIPLFSITRMIKSKSNFSQTIGYIQASISKYELQNKINNAIMEKDGTYFILNESDQIILASNNNRDYSSLLQEYNYDVLHSLSTESLNTLLDGDYFISAQKIDRTPYVICSVITPNVFVTTKSTLVSILSGVAILTAFFFVILALVFSSYIVKPLKELGNKMSSISDENFSVQVNIKGNDEIAILANQFNMMVKRLEYLYKEVYMQEIELKKSQIITLQSQMNPHFLYNTMDTIYWMSEMGNTKSVSKIVSNMSKLLRFSISLNDDDDTISLKDELDNLNSYMEIQKIRNNSNIHFEMEWDSALGHLPVLRLLLQPIVENAIIHGLRDLSFVNIILQIYKQDNCLVYKIMNDGSLIDLQLIHDILHSDTTEIKGFAIRNIGKRLKLKYGDKNGLNYSIENNFTVFTIKQPIL